VVLFVLHYIGVYYMYYTGGLLTLALQFGAKIFQLGRAAIRD